MAICDKQGSSDIEGVCFGRAGWEGDGHDDQSITPDRPPRFRPMLFRTLWPFTAGATGATLSTLSTRATRATRATLSTATFTTSAGPTSRPTTAASRTARPAPHPVNLFRELGQLTTVELAIAIGIKLHGMLDKPLGRGWSAGSTTTGSTTSRSATARPRAALTSARPRATLAGPARPLALATPTRAFK